MFSGSWKEAGQELRNVFDGVVQYFFALWEGIINAIKAAIQKILDMLPSWEGIKSGASSLWEGGREFFGGLFGESGQPESTSPASDASAALVIPAYAPLQNPVPPAGELTALAVPPSVSTSNRNTEISSQTHINQLNMYTQATDAEGIVRDIQGELDRNPLIPGVNAADGGVY